MKVVVPGGTGQVGGVLRRALRAAGHEVVVLSRHPSAPLEPGIRHLGWDGRTLGSWAAEVDGADAVINLAGRSVSCRYTDAHLRQMMDSRVDSARVVGAAIAAAARPPATWLQMSTATIYADRSDEPGNPANDEATGLIGGEEPHTPLYWEYSVRIARRWERALAEADTPHTRRVALRTAIVMNPGRGGAFDVLLRLARLGVGGPVAGGQQYVSWIHHQDLVAAVELLLAHDMSGPVNLASPNPVTQAELMRDLRQAWGGWAARVGLPATRGTAELGAWALRSDTEMLLKSRRVLPGRLLDAGFEFAHPTWPDAAAELVAGLRD
ncbi:epimerase [Nocardioides pyridinolyticus]